MGRKLHIPPPVVKENEVEYLEELAKISEAQNWVEKHSVQDKSSQGETRIIKNDNSKNAESVFNMFLALVYLILTSGLYFCIPVVIVIIWLGDSMQ